MKEAKYDLILDGIDPEVENRDEVIDRISALFKMDRANTRRLLSGGEVVIKKGLSRHRAIAFREAIERKGARCHVRKEASPGSTSGKKTPLVVEEFECPKCGYRSKLPAELAKGDACPSCGVIVEKFLALQRTKPENIARTGNKNDAEDDQRRNSKSDLEKAAEIVPGGGFVRWAKWGITLVGLSILATTGISIFETPSYQVLYRLEEPDRVCADSPNARFAPELGQAAADGYQDEELCAKRFKLDIFNGGMKTQPQTVVRLNLSEDAKDKLVLEPTFLSFDKRVVDVKARLRGNTMSYALGPIEPFDHVTLRMSFVTTADKDMDWSELFGRIDIAKGDVVYSEAPKFTLITRTVLGMLSVFDSGLMDVAETAADLFLDGDASEGEIELVSQEFDSGGADLSVAIETPIPEYARYGGGNQIYSVSIQVKNHGPTDASNVLLSYRIPDNVYVQSHVLEFDRKRETKMEIIQESKRRPNEAELPKECEEKDDGMVACKIERIPPEEGARVFLRVAADTPGTYKYWAGVESEKVDQDFRDNEDTVWVTAE